MRLLNKIEELFCGLALLTTIIVLFFNIVLRYVFKSSTSWAEELIKYLMIWIAFIGGSICVRKGNHISIDFICEYLPEWGKKALKTGIFVLAVIFSAAMTFYGVKVILFIKKMGQLSPALQIPMWIPYMAVPIGFALMTIRYLQEFAAYFKTTSIEKDKVEVAGE